MSTSSTITAPPPATLPCPSWCVLDHDDEHGRGRIDPIDGTTFHYGAPAHIGSVTAYLSQSADREALEPVEVVIDYVRSGESTHERQSFDLSDLPTVLEVASQVAKVAGVEVPVLRGEHRMVAESTHGDDGPLLLTIAAAAGRLSIKPWAMLKLADAGVVRTVWLGRHRRVVAESLREYVESLNKARA